MSRPIEISEEEEVYCVLEAAPLAVVAGTAESAGVNSNRPWVFVEILKYRQSFMDLE